MTWRQVSHSLWERRKWAAETVSLGQILTNSLVVRTFFSTGKVISWKTQLQLVRHCLANSKDVAGLGINNLQCLVVTQVSADWLFNLQASPISLTAPRSRTSLPGSHASSGLVDTPLSSQLWKYETPRGQHKPLWAVSCWISLLWLISCHKFTVESSCAQNNSGWGNDNFYSFTQESLQIASTCSPTLVCGKGLRDLSYIAKFGGSG